MINHRFIQKSFITALLAGCFCVASCENDSNLVHNLFEKQTGIEEGLDITSYISQNAVMKAKLTAPYMLRYMVDSSYVEFPRSLHVDFYDDSTKIESTVDALYARYKEREGLVFLRDSVVVINLLRRDTLKTSELWWDQDKQEFYTSKPVWVYQPDKRIYGEHGLTASQNFDSYTFFGASGTVFSGTEGLLE